MIRRLLRAPVLLAFPVALGLGACTEQLDTAGGCPALCPGQELEVLDTLIDPAVVLDTTLDNFPLLGLEPTLLLASRGDTLDLRPIIRFDSLARVYVPIGGSALVPVEHVDSASLTLLLRKTKLALPDTFHVDVYDVTDTLQVDTLPQALLPLFTPTRRIGTVAVPRFTADTATVKVMLDTAWLRGVVEGGAFFRVGLQARSTLGSVQVGVATSDDAATGARLRYRVDPDTAVSAVNVIPLSFTPRAPKDLGPILNDYLLVADAPQPRLPGRFVVGGLPAKRTYLRFELPRRLLDSTAVIRAQLELTQDPLRDLDLADTIRVRAQLVIAGRTVTDISRAARLLAPAGLFEGDQLILTPGDSGVRRLELNALLRAWRRVEGRTEIPNAIVLTSESEATSPLAARFFGLAGPTALRPRIRVSYVPSIRYGQP